MFSRGRARLSPPSRFIHRAITPALITTALNGCGAQSDRIERAQIAPNMPHLRPLNDIVTNGDVEDGLAPWLSVRAQLKPVAIDPYSGNWSLMVWQRNAAWHGAVMPLGPLTQGRRYKAQVYVKLPARSASSAVSFELHDALENTASVTLLSRLTPKAGEWTLLQGIFDHPRRPTHHGGALAITADDAHVIFFVDRLSVEDIGPADESAADPATSDLALNGGSEVGLDYWSAQAAKLEWVSVPARSGGRSVRVYNRTYKWSGPTMRFRPLQEGEDYLFSVYVLLPYGSSPVTAQLTIKRRADDVDHYVPVADAKLVEGEWTLLSGVYHHSSADKPGEIYAYVEAETSDTEYFVDDFTVEPARQP